MLATALGLGQSGLRLVGGTKRFRSACPGGHAVEFRLMRVNASKEWNRFLPTGVSLPSPRTSAKSRAPSHFVAVICSRYVLITRACCVCGERGTAPQFRMPSLVDNAPVEKSAEARLKDCVNFGSRPPLLSLSLSLSLFLCLSISGIYSFSAVYSN